MNTSRAQLKSLLLSVLFASIAGVGLWLEARLHFTLLRVLTVSFGILAVGTVIYALWKRQTSPATRLSSKAFRRLWVCGFTLLALTFVALGTKLAHDRAYGLVHPGRSLAERTLESVGISKYQVVSFPSADGLTLHGWYVPPRNGAVMIFVHGLGGNRSELLDDARLLAEHGYGALLFDLRNSGESEGQITTLGLQEVNDVEGAVEFVRAQPGVDPDRMGLFGHSMGGATVILAGARNPQVTVVVAQSAYTSIEDNISDSLRQLIGLPPFPFAPLVVFFGEREAGVNMGQVRPVDEIASLSPRPVLLVHGAQDEVVPVTNAYDLYAAAREPKEIYVIANAGHAGLPQAEPEEYERRIVGFLDETWIGLADSE